MSETPRDEGEPEFRDPTAPVETSRTQSVPAPGAVPPPPGPPPGAPAYGAPAPGSPAYGAPAPGAPAYGQPPAQEQRNPFASPPEGGTARSPYAAPPPPPADAQGYGAPAYAPPGQQSPPGYLPPGQSPPGYLPPGQSPSRYQPPGYGGAPGYGAPGYPGLYAPSQPLRGATIALLVVAGLGTLFGGWGIPALILGIIAAARKDEPSTSASLTRWGWIALVVCFVLAVLVIIALVGLAATFSTNNSFAPGA